MAKITASISREWVSFGDDANNSYGIPDIEFDDKIKTKDLVSQILDMERFFEVTSQNFDFLPTCWVLEVNRMSAAIVINGKNKTKVRCYFRNVSPLLFERNTCLYFRQVGIFNRIFLCFINPAMFIAAHLTKQLSRIL